MTIAGRTVVLTGASSGIGEAAAYQLARRGARLCLVARRADELERVRAAIVADGGDAWCYAADLSQPDAVAACAERILAEHPRIDVLVNNAARSIRRPITEALDRLHDYERTMQLNYLGAVQLTLKLLPRFLEQGTGQVINASTMSSQVPIPLFSAYLASKAALESFSRSLSAELGDRGIAVTVLYFPMVRTPMSSRTSIYKHMPMLDVQAAAGWIVRAVERRPGRVSSLLGSLGQVAMAALPQPLMRVSRPLFRQMDARLKRRLQDDGN